MAVRNAKAEALAYLEAKAKATAKAAAKANAGISPLRLASVEMTLLLNDDGAFDWKGEAVELRSMSHPSREAKARWMGHRVLWSD